MTDAHWIAIAVAVVFLLLFAVPLLRELHVWLDERHRRRKRRQR